MITVTVPEVMRATGIMTKGLKGNLEAILVVVCLKCIILMSWKTSGTFGIPNLTFRDTDTDLFKTLKPGAYPRTNRICKWWSTLRLEYAGGTDRNQGNHLGWPVS